MGARRGHMEGYSVSGSGEFHIGFVVGATAGQERDARTALHGWAWVAGAERNMNELLEMGSKYSGELGRMYPPLA